ncbi:uncharacterized protein BX664DRAFT_109421 [Halteromyces radiatus]|uniref:uncharacterized protein n=1 Tax=Halteromyces radiatus TaxID=101107 RepID=UPI00221E68D4|nr:uncharacterized protein BX664DRAFT_109421 [Halteromyces radiatus]KAI8093529.1 hypothetical protein BX664DRAFT_109421 [Halteromyces radiatus]
MDQDKEFLDWVMQNNPMEGATSNFELPQQQYHSTPQQPHYPNYPPYQPTYDNESNRSFYQNTPSMMHDKTSQHLPSNYSVEIQHQMHYSGQHSHQQPKESNINNGTGRLSDEDEENYTEAQLKMMTSKERRQLRNKISARNFRNRRKGKKKKKKKNGEVYV